LLRASLRSGGRTSPAGEQPNDREARERLDQRIEAKADECDAARGNPRRKRDRELDDMPPVAAPGEQLCPMFELRALSRREPKL